MSIAEPMHGSSGAPAAKTVGLLMRRAPGQSVMEEVLALHDARPPRSRLQRILGVAPLAASASSWYQGALGERVVGRQLAALGPEWKVLHAVPVGEKGADIDHVVIGPTGVFTLNTKHHADQSVWAARGAVLVNGRRQPYIRNAEHEATRAGRLLSAAVCHHVAVQPVIVVVGARRLVVKEKHRSVAVLTSDQLLRALTRRPVVLSPEHISLLAAAAAQPSTWRRSPPVLQPPADVVARFAVLEKLVRQARRRRLGWILAAPVAVLASAAGALPPF
ncbi:nuclease-related domain-containing protein [Arthrobacter agilis]|uniref:nuclease-related domain-containing protein n=1 Tax=Arthrobacter agilis TaxID=37921 RepID=UPI0023654BC0|nr:nuclease-related domain-containing protein [Arthrobacter agilis]WDF34059.1 nuclease-related domain-containing protein [Arthrobacter agilis]